MTPEDIKKICEMVGGRAQLADKLGRSPDAVTKYKVGTRHAKGKALEKLEELYLEMVTKSAESIKNEESILSEEFITGVQLIKEIANMLRILPFIELEVIYDKTANMYDSELRKRSQARLGQGKTHRGKT